MIKKWWTAGIATLVLTGILSGVLWVSASNSSSQISEILVVAHRAGAAVKAENSLAALEQAMKDKADFIEVDIQQLADGTLIAMHDPNFYRTTGWDQNVWETDSSDLALLNEKLGQEQSYEPIPTLEEILQGAKNQILLMLELKNTGKETKHNQQIVEMIQSEGMIKQCVIGSMDLETLKDIKSREPLLQTVYIAKTLQGKDYDLSYIDSYSIELLGITPEMVARVHEQGKPIYCWTVNQKKAMGLAVELQVDGIVTDKVSVCNVFLGKV